MKKRKRSQNKSLKWSKTIHYVSLMEPPALIVLILLQSYSFVHRRENNIPMTSYGNIYRTTCIVIGSVNVKTLLVSIETEKH